MILNMKNSSIPFVTLARFLAIHGCVIRQAEDMTFEVREMVAFQEVAKYCSLCGQKMLLDENKDCYDCRKERYGDE